MKKIIIPIMALTAILSGCDDKNPLLSPYTTPYNTPPFEKIKLEHYMPAFLEGIKVERSEIDAIVKSSEPATFDNTIVALEECGRLLNGISMVFFNLNSSMTSDEMEKIALEVQPLLTELSNDISLNPELFARVKAAYSATDQSKLTSEQKILLTKTLKSFVRSGADLDQEQKILYRQYTTELSSLTLKFQQNVLAETNAFHLNIAPVDSAKVAQLPDYVREAMAEEATAKGETGWTVTLQASSFVPFMTYSKERELKQTIWTKYNTRAFGGPNDNRQNVLRITELRLKIANLLGYKTYADYVLEERMIESSANANAFLNELHEASIEYSRKDFQTIKSYAIEQRDYPNFKFMPWDFGYYEEKYKTEKYSLNEELIKPYLKFENVLNGVFILAKKLYGLEFRPTNKIQKYHPEVETFEVWNDKGEFMAILYTDFFPRESKRGGAWMTSFREMYTDKDGKQVRPLVSINGSFTKPTATTPSLLTMNEFTTLLHEFGHALHGILAQGKYESVTGTNVYQDFVELPSQITENWATEKEFLDLWAVHYQTGEKIPAELIEKITAAKNYMAAYQNTRQLSFAMNDMAWHSITEPVTMEVDKFERLHTERTQLMPRIDGTCMSTAFTHIFAGGYAAGYYSYKWAEVLEADAFSLFEQQGVMNRKVADSFHTNILSKGGSEHPMDLYVRFRGQKPTVDALLVKMGVKALTDCK